MRNHPGGGDLLKPLSRTVRPSGCAIKWIGGLNGTLRILFAVAPSTNRSRPEAALRISDSAMHGSGAASRLDWDTERFEGYLAIFRVAACYSSLRY